MKEGSDNPIVKHTFDFALEIMAYCEGLNENRKWVVANQILRSGTSIGANVREAQNTESKLDFIHKFKIAAKETDETTYWLELCQASPDYPDCDNLLNKVREIKRIINKIISTSKSKIQTTSPAFSNSQIS